MRYSKLFSNLYRFATVWLDTMHWQPPHVRMGMKIDLVSSNFQASNCLVYEGLDEVLRIESRKGGLCEAAMRDRPQIFLVASALGYCTYLCLTQGVSTIRFGSYLISC